LLDVKQLFLHCPAWNKHGTVKTVKVVTVILHSRSDEVMPFAEVGTDHLLADQEP
jgi:hypothetical protein